jgi:hypothetical protein
LRQAGLKDYKYIDWFREHPLEDDLKLMKWNDEILGGKAYVEWHPFEHPQLGKVELGGWDILHNWVNPPSEFLEKEIQLFPDWIIWHTLISPKLTLREASVKAIGKTAYRVRMVVENDGWLPTYITKKALNKKVVRGVICEIEIPPGATLQTGKVREEFTQLEGRAYHSAFADVLEGGTDDRVKVEWVVDAPKGGKVRLVARHERAGVVRAELDLQP